MIIRDASIENFDIVTFEDISKGQIVRFKLEGTCGMLHLTSLYLDFADKPAQISDIRKLFSALGLKVHNLIAGDFYFVMDAFDRVSRAPGMGCSHDASVAKLWSEFVATAKLSEFEQPSFTCETSHGQSRIDRIYTNLHPAFIATMHSACTVISHPRQLSDHAPVSFSMQHTRPP